jgi:hypothetical protein
MNIRVHKANHKASDLLKARSLDAKDHVFRSFLEESDDDKRFVPKTWHPRDAIYVVRPWLASFEGLDFVILESSGDKQVNNQRDLTTRVIYQSIFTFLDFTLASLTSVDINQGCTHVADIIYRIKLKYYIKFLSTPLIMISIVLNSHVFL